MLFILRNFLTKFAALNVVVIVLATWQVVPTQAGDDEDITIVPVVSLLLSDPFSVTGGSVIEGDSDTTILNFTFKLDTYIDNASIDYTTQDGTATGGDDYETDSGKVTFSTGSLSVNVPITINGDFDPEANETFSLILSNPVNLKLSVTNVTGTILDDDGSLNDTGITWGGMYPSGNTSCPKGVVPSEQDCSHGTNQFDFTQAGSCVKDNVTGLMWEVKTDDGGLHDKNHTYTWYNTDSATNGGTAGSPDSGGNTCHDYEAGDPGKWCNTQAYVKRVNTARLCGESDWRMPTHKELLGIVSYDTKKPAIDTDYFPNTAPDLPEDEWKWRYWS
ncbi:MAG: DUF1566 domain-containing protein, partial [Thermodesulfobacteriota bacterium]|nr:DUF1566 domain-containing protein [Thermodesulfobacteriota bacterium]